MKNITLLLALVTLVQDISCNEDFLSKFSQNKYKIRDVQSEVVHYNKTIFHLYEFKTFKFNRTTTAHNCTLYGKVNFENKLEVLVQVYKFLSNEFRYFPIRFQANLKKVFDANIMGLKNVVNCGNVSDFIFHKDVFYYFCYYVVDETRFPPLIPNGKYKVEVRYLYLNQEVVLLNLIGEIYTPISYPKK